MWNKLKSWTGFHSVLVLAIPTVLIAVLWRADGENLTALWSAAIFSLLLMIWLAGFGITGRFAGLLIEWRVGIRGTMGGDNRGWTVNLDYGENEMPGMEDARMFKAGLEWKTNVWREKVGRDGIAASVSTAIEKFENVPGAMHDEIAKVNVKFVYPLTFTLKIPFSVTWANHADLLTDESDVRGNIGFTVDFDNLLTQGIQ